MCRVEFAEPSKLTEEITRRARKDHVCGECRRTIHPGERYEFVKGLGDMDVWFEEKTCTHCTVARVWLERECGGWIYGEVCDELEEHWYEDVLYRTFWLARVIAGMKHRWHDGRDPVPDTPPTITA